MDSNACLVDMFDGLKDSALEDGVLRYGLFAVADMNGGACGERGADLSAMAMDAPSDKNQYLINDSTVS